MGNQDKFSLLIRKPKAFIYFLVDDKSRKSTSPNCWCFRNSVLYNATRWLHEVFLIMRLNSARMPGASTAALLIMLFDPSYLLDISSDCSGAPRMGFAVTRQRSHGTLWRALIFQVPLMGLVPSQTDLRCSGEYDSLLMKDAKEKRFYDILLAEIPAFREVSSPWQCATVFSCVFWVARLEKVGWLLNILAQNGKKESWLAGGEKARKRVVWLFQKTKLNQ